MHRKQLLALLAVTLPVAHATPLAAKDLHPDILTAMNRDLGLDAEQAAAQIASDLQASTLIDTFEENMGGSFAGGWIDDNKVFIGVTDESSIPEVVAAGATPIVMTNSLHKLQDAQKRLDSIFMNEASSLTAAADEGIATYYVDLASNKLIINALEASHDDARGLAQRIGLTESEFAIKTVTEMPQTAAATIRGGDAYYFGGRCSIGFAVTVGFATAGHCGKQGVKVSQTKDGAAMGTVGGSIFPGSDMGFVNTVQGTTLTADVNGYGQGSISVTGHQQAAVGTKICRSGSTTQVKCGSITKHNTSVRYQEGTISGVTSSTACCEPGDSDGSWFVGGEAQGVTSGTRGGCKPGGESYYQPLNPLLQKWNLKLVTK